MKKVNKNTHTCQNCFLLFFYPDPQPGLRSRFKILLTPAWKCLPTRTPQKKLFSPTPQKFFPRLLKKYFDSRLLKYFSSDYDSRLLKIWPGSRLLKTYLSYNKIIVIFKESESACYRQFLSRKLLCLFFRFSNITP